MGLDKKTPGLALLLMGKDKDGAKGEHQEHEALSDEELEEARKDAGEAIMAAHSTGDHEALIDHHYALHKLHAEKMRREEGEE